MFLQCCDLEPCARRSLAKFADEVTQEAVLGICLSIGQAQVWQQAKVGRRLEGFRASGLAPVA